MKTQNPGQRFKHHKDKLFNLFIEGLKTTKKQSMLQDKYCIYRICTFNKVSENYFQYTDGVKSDSVSRIECHLPESFVTLGVSFTKKEDVDFVSILFQQDFCKTTTSRGVKQPRLVERYRSKKMTFDDIKSKLKDFYVSIESSGDEVCHQTISNFLIEHLDMTPEENVKYIKSKTCDGVIF